MLQTDRRFELPDLHLELRSVTVIEIGVENLYRATPEVRHEHKVEIAEDRAFDHRPRAPQKKAVVAFDTAVFEKRPGIELQHGPQIDRKSPVGRTEGKALFTDADFRRVAGFGLGRFLFEFAISFQDADFLVQLFDLLFETLDRIDRVIRRQTVGADDSARKHCYCDSPGVGFHLWSEDRFIVS